MSSEKEFYVRFQQLTNTEADWKNTNFIPKKGEIIIFQEEGDESSKLKIGNGKSALNDIPFFGGQSGGDVDLSEIEENIAEIEQTIGNFEGALARIIEIQNSLIGGEE